MEPGAWHRHAPGSEAGVLIQVGIHHVDNVLWLLGPARLVSARFGYGELGPQMPVTAVVIIEHIDGGVPTITSSWITPSHYRMDVLATGGNLSFQLDHGRWSHGDVDDASHLTLDSDGAAQPYPWTKGDPLVEQLDELGASARNGTPMTVGVVDGLRSIAVVRAAVRSAGADGQAVAISDLLRDEGATPEEITAVAGTGGG